MSTQRFFAFLVVSSLLFHSCAGAKRNQESAAEGNEEYQGQAIEDSKVTEEKVDEQETYGPTAPGGSAPTPSPVPEPSGPPPPIVPAAQEPKLCLVLGPGMAKGIAHASVLEAIRKSGLPVHCVVGTEMGALVGALFSANNGNTNSLQWQLFKLNKENYFNFPLLSLRDPKSSGKKLHEFLRDIFRNKKIEELPIRFGTAASDPDDERNVNFDHGDLVDALSASLAMPGVFDAWKVGGEALASGAVSSPAPFELAKQLGGSFLVLVDVVEDTRGATKVDRFSRAFSAVRNLLRLQKREANFVIQVQAGALPFDDFSRQGEMLAAGARAAEKSVPELKAAWEKWIAGQK